MDLWFSEVHTPDVKLSLRTAKQLYAGKSEWQDIEVLDTPAFHRILYCKLTRGSLYVAQVC